MSSSQLRLRHFVFLCSSLFTCTAWAGGNGPVRSVPTLDEFALLGMAAALGVAGVFALWRRKK